MRLMEFEETYLYHATKLSRLMNILCGDEITPRTSVVIVGDVRANSAGFRYPTDLENKQLWGVSTTRNPVFAASWDAFETSDRKSLFNRKTILVLDKRKLQMNHQILPYDYFSSVERNHDYRQKRLGESEEFIPGGIKNLSKYLVSIIMTEATITELRDICIKNPNYPVEQMVANHPKLNAYIPPILRKYYP